MGATANHHNLDKARPSFKNKLINGDFKINQRGYVSATATTVANEYTLDRWRVVTLGQALTFSETNGIVTITAPLDGIEQIIEPLLAGDYFFSKGSGTATITVSESSDNITYTPITPNADGSYSVTGYNYVKVNIKNGTATFVQLEEGSVATAFEQRPIGLELSLCQRYFWKTLRNTYYQTYTWTTAQSNTRGYVQIPFPVRMRVLPTVVLTGRVGGSYYGLQYGEDAIYIVVGNQSSTGTIYYPAGITFDAEL